MNIIYSCIFGIILSLIGFPPFAGFTIKYNLIVNLFILNNFISIFSIINIIFISIVSVFFYIKLLFTFNFHKSEIKKTIINFNDNNLFFNKLIIIFFVFFILFLPYNFFITNKLYNLFIFLE